MESSSDIYQAYLDAHNKARTEPQSLLPILEERLSYFDGNYLRKPGETKLRTKEGPSGVEYV